MPGNHLPSKTGPTVPDSICIACQGTHRTGYCPLKLATVEHCRLCGIAHYGSGPYRNCPHLNSVTQCRAMLETLKSSTESEADILQAKKYLVGVIGGLNRKKKQREANALQPMNNNNLLQQQSPSALPLDNNARFGGFYGPAPAGDPHKDAVGIVDNSGEVRKENSRP